MLLFDVQFEIADVLLHLRQFRQEQVMQFF